MFFLWVAVNNLKNINTLQMFVSERTPVVFMRPQVCYRDPLPYRKDGSQHLCAVNINGDSVVHTEKAMAPHSSTLAWKIHGQWSLVGRSPWGHKESDTTERLPFHFSLSCIGEGNSNPLQCSCLENPRDGKAWWAAIYGVTQSWTRLSDLATAAARLCIKY